MRLSTKLNFRWMQNWASGVDAQTSSHLPSVNKAGRRGGTRQTEDSLAVSSFDWSGAWPTTTSWDRLPQSYHKATTALKLKGEPGLDPTPDTGKRNAAVSFVARDSLSLPVAEVVGLKSESNECLLVQHTSRWVILLRLTGSEAGLSVTVNVQPDNVWYQDK